MKQSRTQQLDIAGGAQETDAVEVGRGGRMSRQRKTAAVLRLLRGEDLETVFSLARCDRRHSAGLA